MRIPNAVLRVQIPTLEEWLDYSAKIDHEALLRRNELIQELINDYLTAEDDYLFKPDRKQDEP